MSAQETSPGYAFDLARRSAAMNTTEPRDRRPYVERKAALRKLCDTVAASSTSNTLRAMATDCLLPRASSARGIVSKKFDAPYRSGSSKTWIKVKNPNAPAATRVIDGTF